jgi:hypothetical protein
VPHATLSIDEAEFSGGDGDAIEFSFVEAVAQACVLGVVRADAVAISGFGRISGSGRDRKSAGQRVSARGGDWEMRNAVVRKRRDVRLLVLCMLRLLAEP